MKNEQVTTKQHPVPQNIMEVEFKLIGDMTIRQFSYVAVGGFLCYLIFSGGLPALIRWPLLFLVGFLSLGLAFLPVEEQGLDEWIRNFFVATYSPTQRVWGGRKGGQKPARAPQAKKPPEKVKAPLPEVGKRIKDGVADVKNKRLNRKQADRRVRAIAADLEKIVATLERSEGKRVSGAVQDENLILKKRLRGLSAELSKLREEQGFGQAAPDLKRTADFYQERVKTLEEKIKVLEKSGDREKEAVKDKSQAAPEVKEEYQKQIAVLKGESAGLSKKVSVAEAEITKLRKELETLQHAGAASSQRVSERDSELKRLEDERNRAVASLDRLQRRISGLERPRQPVTAHQVPSPAGEEKKEEGKPQVKEKVAPIIDGLPNVVSGVVKGPKGELSAGVMVVIEDVDGDLVRALKTNKLGQFVIATPLPNGDYTVRVKNVEGASAPVKVRMDGSVLEPIVFRVGG